MFLDKIVPEIPKAFRERFRERQTEAGLDSLRMGALLLTLCFAVEAYFQSVGRTIFFVAPLVLAFSHACLAFAMIRYQFRPRRVALWQFASIMSVYGLTLLSLLQYAAPQIVGYQVLALVALCVMTPFAVPCLVGGIVIGTTMIVLMYIDSVNDLGSIVTFVTPTISLALLAFLGRQRSIRNTFLKDIQNEGVTKELRLSKLALDTSSQFVLRLTAEGAIEYCNVSLQCALQYSQQELRNKFIYEISPAWTADQWTIFFDNLVHTESERRELRLRSRLGDIIPTEVQFDLVATDEQPLVLAIASDLTQRERLNEEIQRVQKLEGLATLAGGIAHDYNNLLVPVITNGHSLLNKLDFYEDQECIQSVRDILSATEQAANLTQQLLVYTGKIEAERSPMSIGAELNAIAKLLRSAVPRNVQLRILDQNQSPVVVAERGQIQQILMNLVINAAQAIGEREGSVSVHIGTVQLDETSASRLEPPMNRTAGEYVVCEIVDDGCGMTDEVRRRMFDPFYTNKANGRGLGLSAVLGIVRNHKGGIHVDSMAGVGTTIRLYLPSAGEGDLATSCKWQAPRKHSAATVLIADDEELIRSTTRRILERNEMMVLEARTGFEVCEILERETTRIDAAIIDIRMPGPSLREVIERLLHSRPNLGIVACSGCPKAMLDAEINEVLEPHRFMMKPYDPRELIRTIQAVTASSLEWTSPLTAD